MVSASFLLSTAVVFQLLGADGVRSSSQSTTPTCSTDLDCSLNGVCSSLPSKGAYEIVRSLAGNTEQPAQRTNTTIRRCQCDKPWQGSYCDKLKFVPLEGRSTSDDAIIAIGDQGYGMVPNVTTWGGGILAEPAGDDTPTPPTRYHLYVSRMTNGCSLKDWTTNSRIDHAVSEGNIRGPYRFVDVAVPTFSHNPAPIELWPPGDRGDDGAQWKYAIFHIGMGTNGEHGGKDCLRKLHGVNGSEPYWMEDYATSAQHTDERQLDFTGSTIHVSESLNGPWIPLDGHDLGDCNNPAPWVHPSNGTIYVACGDGGIRRSEHVRGPYEVIARFPDDHSSQVNVAYEDPFLYTDARGRFHCLYHVYERFGGSDDCTHTRVAAHAYSEDGYDWHMSPMHPYGAQVEVQGGASVVLASRERPKLFFRDGVPTHLVEGVCGSPFCDAAPYKPWCVHCKYQQWDFTLVSALDAS